MKRFLINIVVWILEGFLYLIIWVFRITIMMLGMTNQASRQLSGRLIQGEFQTELCLQDLGDGETFQLLNPLLYKTDPRGPGRGEVIVVETGFITDLASTGPARPILPKSGPYNRAAVVHDKLCTDRCLPSGRLLSWHECSQIFREAAYACPKCNHFLAQLMYYAIDFFGEMRHAR